ncbi:aliphatic sulfonates ABC transporter ATP-binding protein [Eoetvoesiella caeni]
MTDTQHGLPLQLRAVHKQLGSKAILRDMNLTIPAGQFVAVVGRSGCGKSTLLRLLAGLDAVSDGGIETEPGQSVLDAKSQIRLMFQDSRLLPWKSVIGNVGLGLKGDYSAKALQALEAVGLKDRAQDWPATLSGGQRQRVALARALVHQPRLLLLDEPLGALDALTRIEMQQLIEKLWRQHGFTVLLVTHDVTEAVSVADRVILIEDGQIGLDVPVQAAHPRVHGSAQLAALEGQILNRILSPSQKHDSIRPVSPAPVFAPSKTLYTVGKRTARQVA